MIERFLRVAHILAWSCTILAMGVAQGRGAFASTGVEPVRAFYLQHLPSDYASKERLILSLRDTGANAVMIDLPVSVDGLPEHHKLPDIIYLIHKARLKAFVILPVRTYPGLLLLHPDWEDVRYDVRNGSRISSGKLDLFNTNVVFYLDELARQIASFPVDGIFLGSDFSLGPGEAMSETAFRYAEKKLRKSVTRKRLLKGFREEEEDGGVEDEFVSLVRRWQEVKRDRLLDVYDYMTHSARAARASLVFGIPVPIVLPVPVADNVLAGYAYDMGMFARKDVDYYWMLIPYREMKEDRDREYSENREMVARSAWAASTIVRDPARTVAVLEATNEKGRLFPLSELEEMTALVRNARIRGLGYGILTKPVRSY